LTISDRAEFDDRRLGDFEGVSDRVCFDGAAAFEGLAMGGLWTDIWASFAWGSMAGSGFEYKSNSCLSSLIFFDAPSDKYSGF
jgi:hypothetical protein